MNQLIIKTDGEPAIVVLREAIAKYHGEDPGRKDQRRGRARAMEEQKKPGRQCENLPES